MRTFLLFIIMLLVGCSGLPYDAAAASTNKGSVQKTDSSSSSSKSKSDSDALIGCSGPSKTYGVSEIDDFLSTSFEICEALQSAQKLLSDINEFLADPTAFIAKKGAEAKANLKKQLSSMIISVSQDVIKKTTKSIAGSGDITKAAKSLKGLNKIKAVKDVAGAIKNLKSISKTAPKVLNEMSTLASKLSN